MGGKLDNANGTVRQRGGGEQGQNQNQGKQLANLLHDGHPFHAFISISLNGLFPWDCLGSSGGCRHRADAIASSSFFARPYAITHLSTEPPPAEAGGFGRMLKHPKACLYLLL
jgi:hypothetical protein